MKKTLFAMMALAFCGTAFADEPLTFKTSEYTGQMFGQQSMMFGPYNVAGDARIIVDSGDATGQSGKQQGFAGNLTVYFENSVSWKTQCNVGYDAGLNITSSAAVAQSWLDTLVAGEQITLFNNVTPNTGFNITAYELHFDGVAKDEKVDLAGTELTFKGLVYFPDTLSLGDNEIAIMRMVESNKTTGFALVGGNITATPVVPEPATATLSLLALAGLATRRKRK